MAKITGTYLPGGMSDAIYLSCYAALIAAAREQLRGAPVARQEPTALGGALVQGMPYVAMLVSFLVLVYVESSSMSSPATAMTVIIFALTLLVMLRQGVMSRDDALVRERRAAGIVEARYASLIKNASDVIMIADVDGRLRFASPAAERTFGMHPDDLVGRNLLDLWGEADRERLAAFLAEVASTHGRSIGPVEVVVGNGARRSTLESVGSNLLDDPAIAGLALNFRDVSERKALEEQLRQLAFHDPLTLLANRSLFRNRVQHALTLAQRSHQRVAVMFLDLDNFKNVNDSLGHDAGDRLLQAAAQRLVKSTRPSDTVARLGGDEFAILLEGISESTDVERDRRDRSRAPSTSRCSSTAATPTWRPASASPSRSRATTPSSCCATPTSRCTTRRRPARRVSWCSSRACRSSCASGCASRRTSTGRSSAASSSSSTSRSSTSPSASCSASRRWCAGTTRSTASSCRARSSPTAEESGQIIELGRWVLAEACRAVKAWRDTIVAGDGLRVAVNISGRHLQHADLVADVRAALDASGLEPGNLVIELTESTIMHNTEVNLERFRELKALGVRLAIDDFGMGYSSLSYLHRFPIDILKIDRSFVGRLTEQDDGPELARAVVMLGETLGLETVAEGVEHEEQVAKLLELGCVAAQGFLFARSAPLKDVSAMPFVARRAELRNAQALGDRLTATGRFNVGNVKARSVA